MATKTELVEELARLTNEPKVTFKGKSKEKLIILLHETRKRKNSPKRGKHVWLGTPRKRRKFCLAYKLFLARQRSFLL